MNIRLSPPICAPASVSVIIPAYNAARTICRAIDSVLAQTVPALEVIVIDDGSPDNQHALIQAYGDRVVLIRQPNGKTARARNTGIDRARGEFIAFLDADDFWEPHKLKRQLEVFDQHPEVALVAGDFFEQAPGGSRQRKRFPSEQTSGWDHVLEVNRANAFRLATRIWTGVTIIRREALADKRFLSGLEPAEDRDLWFRIAVRHPIFLLSEPLATAVLEPGSISRASVDTDCASLLKVIQRHRHLLGNSATRLWRSHTLYRWAALEPRIAVALARLSLSCMLWPWPYTGFVDCYRLGRIKCFGTLLRQTLRSLPISILHRATSGSTDATN